jgi:phage internal scaffolding protein
MDVRNRHEVYKSGLDTGSESKVKKSQQEATDINNIVERWLQNGAPPGGLWHNRNQPVYADFSNVQEFNVMLNQVRQAEADFAALPAHIRAQFDNDPAKLVDWLSRLENEEEAQEKGILPKEQERAQQALQNEAPDDDPAPDESPRPE